MLRYCRTLSFFRTTFTFLFIYLFFFNTVKRKISWFEDMRFSNYPSYVCVLLIFIKIEKGGGGGKFMNVSHYKPASVSADDTRINFNALRAYELTRVPLLADISQNERNKPNVTGRLACYRIMQY